MATGDGPDPSAPAREVEQARCPTCAGTGMQHYIGCGHGGIDPPEASVEVCSDCSGSGRLSAPAPRAGPAIVLPEPDDCGTYAWSDGCRVWRRGGLWVGCWADQTMMAGADGAASTFDSPEGAAAALAAGGEGPATIDASDSTPSAPAPRAGPAEAIDAGRIDEAVRLLGYMGHPCLSGQVADLLAAWRAAEERASLLLNAYHGPHPHAVVWNQQRIQKWKCVVCRLHHDGELVVERRWFDSVAEAKEFVMKAARDVAEARRLSAGPAPREEET
jgi:hypothetical protein